MLKPAIFYVDQLQRKYAETILEDSFKFYSNGSNVSFVLDVYNNTSDKVQFVSMVDDEIIGYFGCRINRETDTAYDIEILNFSNKKFIFMLDLGKWFVLLNKTLGVKKAVWFVIIGNPAEKTYDRFVKELGGRVVGTFKEDTKLRDGRLYDVKWYELFIDQMLNGKTKYDKYLKGGTNYGK